MTAYNICYAPIYLSFLPYVNFVLQRGTYILRHETYVLRRKM